MHNPPLDNHKRPQFSHESVKNDGLQDVLPQLLEGFNPDQIHQINLIVEASKPRASQKLVNLNLTVNLIFAKFYVAVLVGQDKRRSRRYLPQGVERFGNKIAALLILASLCSFFTLILFLGLYWIKSWLGINILRDKHLSDVVRFLLG